MKQKIIAVLGAAITVLALTGCPHQALVHNVNDASVAMNINDGTDEDVRKAIIRAGASLGWAIKTVGPGQLEGTLYLRRHMAKVSIPYSLNSYSIIYKDSSELNYDGEKIHSNYNGWIQNLNKAIQVQLSTI